MSTGKMHRKWAPRMPLDEALKTTLGFLIELRSKNILFEKPPTLYQCYVQDSVSDVEMGTPISELMTYSKNHGAQFDMARGIAIRLLAVAAKAHYFLYKNEVVKHEPYLFFIPDLYEKGSSRYGLVYPLERHDLLVAEWDLKTCASGEIKYWEIDKFPVVLSKDSYKWLTKKKWVDLESQIKYSIGDIYKSKQEVDSILDQESFTFGHILDYPYDMNVYLKQIGGIFATGLKKWFLPHGWDIDAVRELLDYKHEQILKEKKEGRDGKDGGNAGSHGSRRSLI